MLQYRMLATQSFRDRLGPWPVLKKMYRESGLAHQPPHLVSVVAKLLKPTVTGLVRINEYKPYLNLGVQYLFHFKICQNLFLLYLYLHKLKLELV